MTVVKHLFSFILGFLSCFLVVMLATIGKEILFNSRTHKDRLFDSDDWKRTENPDERFQMIKDLEYHYISKGMSLADLRGLLGKPDLIEGDTLIGFDIGSSGIFAFEQTLVFKLDNKMLVEDFKIDDK